MGKTHLVIPDAHAHPDYNNNRFNYLGKLIADVKPDTVVCIGDWWDFASLCSHSKKVEIEGARYQADLNAGHDAMERMFYEIKKHKKKLPRFVFTMGNHDIRPDKFVEDNPVFQGRISTDDLQLEDLGWEVYPFLDPARIDGVAYAHYVVSGVMRKPVGGVNVARTLCLKTMESTTVGHGHYFDVAVVNGTLGRKLMGAAVGCYVDYSANYAGIANEQWDRGVLVKHDVDNGVYDPEWISLDRIRRVYGA